MNGVIYARYSSDGQREESIEGQVRECLEYAERNGINVIETYTDRAKTGTNDKRPGLQKMVSDSATKKFEVVLVWRFDRFARNRMDSSLYKFKLKQNGVTVKSIHESISDGPESIITESLFEAMAEYYSAELSQKVKRGCTENALKGKSNGGTIPIGYYINSEHHFAVDPEKAPFVAEAFRRYADGQSLNDIKDFLNSCGIRTVHGNEISYNVVHHMLRNRRYIGEYKYNDVVNKGAIPAIVSEKLFNAVQRRFETSKKAPATAKATEEYILTTKLFCGHCMKPMIGESGKSQTGAVYRYSIMACLLFNEQLQCKAVLKSEVDCTASNFRMRQPHFLRSYIKY